VEIQPLKLKTLSEVKLLYRLLKQM